MEKIKLVLADQDTHFCDLVKRFMHQFPDITIVASEHNGHDALRSIRIHRPDIVLFDLVLQGIDGITLLRNIADQKSPPAMICCTRFYSELSLEALRTYGASYVLYKPIELQVLHPILVSCANLHKRIRTTMCLTGDDTHDNVVRISHIRNYIVSLGIPSKLIGCSYLAEAVRLAQEDESLIRNLSKGLYLEIARSMNSTPVRIERCIRNAISAAYQGGGLDARLISCPSNKEFLRFVLQTIEA